MLRGWLQWQAEESIPAFGAGCGFLALEVAYVHLFNCTPDVLPVHCVESRLFETWDEQFSPVFPQPDPSESVNLFDDMTIELLFDDEAIGWVIDLLNF